MRENVFYLRGCTTLQDVMSLLRMRSLFGLDSLLRDEQVFDEVLAPPERIQELRERLQPTNLLAPVEKDIVFSFYKND